MIIHVDNLHGRTVIRKEHHSKEVTDPEVHNAPINRDLPPKGTKEDHQDSVLKECEEFLKKSQRLRDTSTLKSKGNTSTGRINPTPITKKALRKKDHRQEKRENLAKDYSRTEGIKEEEI
jgi:hypothetical protein